MRISCRSLLFAIALAGAVAFEPWPAHAQSGAYLSGLVAAQAGAAHARIQQQQLDAAARFQRQNPQATILWYVEDTAYEGSRLPRSILRAIRP
ncbi:hypothetical protein EPN44_05845 [bacterium]|nr:MAG: hypothetical protein EPN44_05845 [bacterium]